MRGRSASVSRAAAWFCCSCALCPAASRASATGATLPPSSLEPPGKTAPVRVSHRHRTIRECVHVRVPPSCDGRVAEADTATEVTFARTGATNVSFRPAQAVIKIAFPSRVGRQEQVVVLPVGDWLVDWPGAPRIEQLEVRPGSHLQVALTTASGACALEGDRCELREGFRERRIRVSEGQNR
jgi:hypothetical protein